MENEKIAGDALLSAKRWLETAHMAAGEGNYDSAVYSLEMSVEISLKAVLLSIGTEVPKIHAIGDIFAEAVRGNDKVHKELSSSVEEITRTFKELLKLRSAAGYMFEREDELENLGSEYRNLEGSSDKIVALCEKAVRKLSGSGRR